jgi:hypothetical protein
MPESRLTASASGTVSLTLQLTVTRRRRSLRVRLSTPSHYQCQWYYKYYLSRRSESPGGPAVTVTGATSIGRSGTASGTAT